MKMRVNSYNVHGSFGFVRKQKVDWIYCRDNIAFYWKRQRKLAFRTDVSPKTIAAFLHHLETTLKIGGKSACIPIYGMKTNRTLGVVIRVAKWWTESFMRRSFFTAAIRCSVVYKGNLEDALFSRASYFRETQYAVKRFLDGYTVGQIGPDAYLPYYYGWHFTFRSKFDYEVDKFLKKPKAKKTKRKAA